MIPATAIANSASSSGPSSSDSQASPNPLTGIAAKALENNQPPVALSSDLASRYIAPLNGSNTTATSVPAMPSFSSFYLSYPPHIDSQFMQSDWPSRKRIAPLTLKDLQRRFPTKTPEAVHAFQLAQSNLIRELNRPKGRPIDPVVVQRFTTNFSKMVDSSEQAHHYLEALGNRKYTEGTQKGCRMKVVMADYFEFKRRLLASQFESREDLAAPAESLSSSAPMSLELAAPEPSHLQGSSSSSSSSSALAPFTTPMPVESASSSNSSSFLFSGLSTLASAAATASSSSSSFDPDRTESDDDETPTPLPSILSSATSFPTATASGKKPRGNWATRFLKSRVYKEIVNHYFKKTNEKLKLDFMNAHYNLCRYTSTHPGVDDFVIANVIAFAQRSLDLIEGYDENTIRHFFTAFGDHRIIRGPNSGKELSKFIPKYESIVEAVVAAKKQNRTSIKDELQSLFRLTSAPAPLSSSSSSSSQDALSAGKKRKETSPHTPGDEPSAKKRKPDAESDPESDEE